jgi:glycosyltransferase involved in cell wall biosynthesis
MKKLISIVVPAYNEEASLEELKARLQNVTSSLSRYDFEFIIVENGSFDNSYEMLLKFNQEDKRFKILKLSRNFGVEGAISAGIRFATGGAVIILFADLQEPPELIPEFIKKWEEGYHVVYGLLKNRKDVSLPRKILYTLFYRVINKMTNNSVPQNATDFRLLDEKVYHLINNFEERSKFMRGISAWVGFRQVGIPYERAPRFAGESKASYYAVTKLAINAITTFSSIPLQVTTIAGFLVSVGSFIALLAEIIMFLIYGREIPGIATTIILMLLAFGLVFFFLGIIGIYIGRIFEEIKRRPDFIIMNTVGFMSGPYVVNRQAEVPVLLVNR